MQDCVVRVLRLLPQRAKIEFKTYYHKGQEIEFKRNYHGNRSNLGSEKQTASGTFHPLQMQLIAKTSSQTIDHTSVTNILATFESKRDQERLLSTKRLVLAQDNLRKRPFMYDKIKVY